MDLSYLADLPDNEFEQERSQIIKSQINRAPEHMRARLFQLQAELDIRRQSMSSEDFMKSLCNDMHENIENLSDQFCLIRNTLNKR